MICSWNSFVIFLQTAFYFMWVDVKMTRVQLHIVQHTIGTSDLQQKQLLAGSIAAVGIGEREMGNWQLFAEEGQTGQWPWTSTRCLHVGGHLIPKLVLKNNYEWQASYQRVSQELPPGINLYVHATVYYVEPVVKRNCESWAISDKISQTNPSSPHRCESQAINDRINKKNPSRPRRCGCTEKILITS